ncbi:hypothetical protein [Myxacorys almedinensis]|uniref:Uncharacterized protein n=1 Tax=Myxacorys almedinensis A TaxID=2690445 RepID=A0A8J7Z4G6_9CYAN|nr:hypothetical protein [Myxacorys almedinensis]NDJ19165.1 hypothetical protein [Myxacorys almedinensis A]
MQSNASGDFQLTRTHKGDRAPVQAKPVAKPKNFQLTRTIKAIAPHGCPRNGSLLFTFNLPVPIKAIAP